jgi:outer membrane protein assembly factor BamB
MKQHIVIPSIFFLFLSTGVFAVDWTQWRGAAGDGVSQAEDLPTEWSETKNVKWKTSLAGRGWSSPVIEGKRIWVTAAHETLASEEASKKRLKSNTGSQPLTVLEKASFHAICIDRDSGKILYDVELFSVDEPQWVHRYNSYASPTPVIEQGRVYCHFGSYGTACIEGASGKVLWKNLDLHCMHENGPGGSPVIAGDVLFFHMDGSDQQFVVALNKKDGTIAWKTKRSGKLHSNPQLKKAYSTPLVMPRSGENELISAGANWVYGYDPSTGDEKWKVDYERLGFSNVARPVTGDGMLFLSTCFMRAEMLGIRLKDQPEILWRYRKSVPSSPSPLFVDGLLFFVGDSGGLVTCLEAKTGKLVWNERIASGKYWAAPFVAAGRIYFHSEEGVTTVIKAARKFEVISENVLDGKLMASAAVSGDVLFLRTDKALYSISNKASSSP